MPRTGAFEVSYKGLVSDCFRSLIAAHFFETARRLLAKLESCFRKVRQADWGRRKQQQRLHCLPCWEHARPRRPVAAFNCQKSSKGHSVCKASAVNQRRQKRLIKASTTASPGERASNGCRLTRLNAVGLPSWSIRRELWARRRSPACASSLSWTRQIRYRINC